MKLIELTDEEKVVLLDFLGYKVKCGTVISKETNKPHDCPYTGVPVKLSNASVMPGSTVIFNTTPLTLAKYFSEHVENRGCTCQKKTN